MVGKGDPGPECSTEVEQVVRFYQRHLAKGPGGWGAGPRIRDPQA